jgi:hypothetical protein
MTFDELTTRATKLFGRRWKRKLAEALDIHLATVYRWEPREGHRNFPVPNYVDMFFELQEQRNKLKRFAKSLTK